MKVDITDDFEKAEKKAKKRREWEARKQEAKDWIDEHKVQLIAAAPVVIKVVTDVVKVIGRRHNLYVEQKQRDLRWYDPSLGKYWNLRRKPTTSESLFIDKRHRQYGESIGELLDDMGLLR